jgi:hypothetical protein
MIKFKGIEINRQRRTISHRGRTHSFCDTRNSIAFNMAIFFLLAGGASKEMVFQHLYEDDPNGGPLRGEECINVMLHQLNKRHLRALDLEIRSWRIAGVSFYEIVPASEARVSGLFSYSRGTQAIKMAGTRISSIAVSA